MAGYGRTPATKKAVTKKIMSKPIAKKATALQKRRGTK